MIFSRQSFSLVAYAVVFIVFSSFPLPAQRRLGANHAEPGVESFMKGIPMKSGEVYSFSSSETRDLVALAEREKINAFELIDCIFRYINPRRMRISIRGADLRSLQSEYDLGGERVLAILSVDTLRYFETGARLTGDQKDLDIYINGVREAYIEIGTAVYEPRFGFECVSPLLFSGAYGIMVRKMFITTPLEKLELFSPGKGAIYVKAINRPKRWNLDVIRKLQQ